VRSCSCEQLHVVDHAIAGAILLELAVFVAGTIVATRSLTSRTAMLRALALMRRSHSDRECLGLGNDAASGLPADSTYGLVRHGRHLVFP
jgi:hypothetical protein